MNEDNDDPILNTKERAAILVQLVAADARVLAGMYAGTASPSQILTAFENHRDSRAELWLLLHPEEGVDDGETTSLSC